jgi:hypothetical protein
VRFQRQVLGLMSGIGSTGLFDSKLAIEVVVEKQVKNPEKRNDRHEEKQRLNGPMHLAMNLLFQKRSYVIEPGSRFSIQAHPQIENGLLCEDSPSFTR